MKNKAMWIVISILLVIVILVASYHYFLTPVQPKEQTVLLMNPVAGLTNEQAVAQFNESFILYLLYSIKANTLHNPPLSSDMPKIVVNVDNDIYEAVISNGQVMVGKGDLQNEDIIIKTTKEEAVKMLQDKSNVANSFAEGMSNIQMVAGKVTLFEKGYLGIYRDLTGKSA